MHNLLDDKSVNGPNMFDLGKEEIKLDCPSCGRKLKTTVAAIAAEQKLRCGGCGETIQLRDKGDSMRTGIRKINDSVKKLQDTVKRISKR